MTDTATQLESTHSYDTWDTTVDLLVVGSGAGGMVTAITAAHMGMTTLIVEKADVYGGNTALSGGGIWVPNNPVLRDVHISDSEDSVVAYLDSITGGVVAPSRTRAYVHNGPEVIRFLQDASEHMKFIWCPGYPDYHPENPGGRPEGRSIESAPVDLRALGIEEKHLRKAALGIPNGLWITQREFRDLNLFMRTWQGRKVLGKAVWRIVSHVVTRSRVATLGAALIARLRLTLRDAGVPLWLNSSLDELVTDTSGRVVGAVIDQAGERRRIRAARGVVIASGGFENNLEMRARHLPPGGQDNFTSGSPSNTGDGIRAGQRAGADTALMDDAWWMPAFRRPDGVMLCMVSERCIPRSVILDKSGNRFVNEAAPYVNFVHTQIAGQHDPIWFIMDGRAKNRYQFGGILPGQKFPKDWYASGTVYKAETLQSLSAKIALPVDNVTASITRFNELADKGVDDDFGRGISAYDRYYGDDSLPNPVLDTIDVGPFYAVRVLPGDLGTKGGLRCDESSRVLRSDDSVIDGLYATGNSSAAVMGTDYAGPGATIGPAMVFGWLAANHASSVLTPQEN